MRLVDDELAKKFDGADGPDELVRRESLLPASAEGVYEVNLKVLSKLILFMRAFKCICIDNPDAQQQLLEAKIGARLLATVEMLLRWGNIS